MTHPHTDCIYYRLIHEYGIDYHCCTHPDKQDPTDEYWARCEQSCDYYNLGIE